MMENDMRDVQVTGKVTSDVAPALCGVGRGEKITAAPKDSQEPPDNRQAIEFEPSKVEKDEVKLTLADVNILGAAWYIIRQRANAVTLIATGTVSVILVTAMFLCICSLCRSHFRVPIRHLLYRRNHLCSGAL